MAQYPPPYSSQSSPPPPPANYPARQMPGGYSPPQTPGSYAPPQMPAGYPIPQQPVGYPSPPMSEGYPAPQMPAGYAPPQAPGSYPALPVPPEIAQQVATYQLGTLAQVYKANLIKLLFFAGITLVATIIDIPAAIADHTGFLALAILLAATAFAIYYLVANYNLKAYVFSEGLVRANGSKIDVMRWEHIEAVWQRIIKYRYRGLIPLYTTYNYTVRRSDGAQFKFTSALKDTKQLGEATEQEVTRHQLPKAIAAYNSGSPVNFGPLSVSLQGISKGVVLLPWNQAGQVDIRRGWVIVHKQGSLLAGSRTRASSVPNLQVFLQLVDYARRRVR